MQKVRLHFNMRGFSVVEVLLAGSIFALMATALVGSYLYGQEATALGGSLARATYLTEEGLEATRNIRDASFANLVDGTYGLATTSNQWTFSGISDAVGVFTRQVTITTVDTDRKDLSSAVSWIQNAQRVGSVVLTTRMTNWQAAPPAVSTCNDAAIQQAYSAGTCRQNVAKCGQNGETNISNADVYCPGGKAKTCCALP